MITLILIIVLIVIIVNRRSNKKEAASSNTSDELRVISKDIQNINEKILEELAKPDPDYEKMKALRAKMEELKERQQQTEIVSQSPEQKQSNNTGVNGLTVALYVGSLLILAGVGAMVSQPTTKTLGLIAMLVMTILFYGGGILMKNSKTLKMASYVFVGTGMMMLPFIGLLVYDITKGNAELIWMIMSLVGVPMYLFAAYIMESKVFSYFAIAGFVSLSCSLASVMSLALVWYFVFVMAIGFVLKILAVTGVKLGVMQESVERAGDWLPIATLAASAMAISNLKELDYVIILGVTVLHTIMGYIMKPNIGRENLLRLIFPAWVILTLHFFFPENKIVGISLMCAALCQLGIVFFNINKGLNREEGRKETELGWLIISMVCFVVASWVTGYGNQTETYIWLSFALVVDSVILFIARYILEQDAWYIGLIITGIALPITITNAIGMPTVESRLIYFSVYLLEMCGLEALFWKNDKTDGDMMTALAVGAFGIGSLCAGSNDHLIWVTLFVSALCLAARGFRYKNDNLKEVAIYCATAGVYFVIDSLNYNLKLGFDFKIMLILLGHLILAGLIAACIMRGQKEPPYSRVIVGCIILLLIVGGVAIANTSWAMYLFLAETVGVLLGGVLAKDSVLRAIGVVGAFLSVLWFTKDLSFVWPIVLGLGIIGTVIFILVKNGQKSLPKK